jgi:hypothetical protein
MRNCKACWCAFEALMKTIGLFIVFALLVVTIILIILPAVEFGIWWHIPALGFVGIFWANYHEECRW